MIEELYLDAHCNVYYRMDNWGGFYRQIINCYCCTAQRERIKKLPTDVRQIIKNGEAKNE